MDSQRHPYGLGVPAPAAPPAPSAPRGGQKTRISPISKGLGLVLAGVSILVVAFSILAGVVWTDGPRASETSSHVYRVGSAPTVGIHVQGADVTVMPGPQGRVTVDEISYASSLTLGLARSVSSDLHTTVTGGGNRLDVQVVEARFKPADLVALGWGQSVVIHVPSAGALQLLTDAKGGDVRVDGLHVTHPLQISTDAGDVTLEGVSVDSDLKVASSAGDIRFQGEIGRQGSLKVTSGVGDIYLTLPALTPARATVHVGAGDFNPGSTWHFRRLASGRTWTADLSPSPTARIDVVNNLGDVSFKAS